MGRPCRDVSRQRDGVGYHETGASRARTASTRRRGVESARHQRVGRSGTHASGSTLTAGRCRQPLRCGSSGSRWRRLGCARERHWRRQAPAINVGRRNGGSVQTGTVRRDDSEGADHHVVAMRRVRLRLPRFVGRLAAIVDVSRRPRFAAGHAHRGHAAIAGRAHQRAPDPWAEQRKLQSDETQEADQGAKRVGHDGMYTGGRERLPGTVHSQRARHGAP